MRRDYIYINIGLRFVPSSFIFGITPLTILMLGSIIYLYRYETTICNRAKQNILWYLNGEFGYRGKRV